MFNNMFDMHQDTHFYANDTLTRALAQTKLQAVTKAQNKLHELSCWYNNDGLILNVSKTQY